MKAALALLAIYIGTFLVAIQGASQNPVQAAQGAAQTAAVKAIDPVKEADIRALMELIGARDLVQDGAVGLQAEHRRLQVHRADVVPRRVAVRGGTGQGGGTLLAHRVAQHRAGP